MIFSKRIFRQQGIGPLKSASVPEQKPIRQRSTHRLQADNGAMQREQVICFRACLSKHRP
jgi:hypothetical protein